MMRKLSTKNPEVTEEKLGEFQDSYSREPFFIWSCTWMLPTQVKTNRRLSASAEHQVPKQVIIFSGWKDQQISKGQANLTDLQQRQIQLAIAFFSAMF